MGIPGSLGIPGTSEIQASIGSRISNSTALELGWRKARKSPIVPGASPVAMDAASLEKGKNNGKTMVNQEGAISGFHGEIMAFMDWFEGFLSETLDMDGM
jgi:hypothetical protein